MEGPSLEDEALWSVISTVEGPGIWSGNGTDSDKLSEDRECRERDSSRPLSGGASVYMLLLSVWLLVSEEEFPLVLHWVVAPDSREVPGESEVGLAGAQGNTGVHSSIPCQKPWLRDGGTSISWSLHLETLSGAGMYDDAGLI